jgi:allantoin racemase
VEEDGAEVIVLGCAGLSGMDREIREALDVPVLDGVVCALILATGFARYGVGTSRVLGYNPQY